VTQALVLTLIGADRPGLVEAVAAVVAAHGGNWVESSLARLAGKFAGVLRIDAPTEQAAALRMALRGLSDKGLQVVVEMVEPAEADAGPGAGAGGKAGGADAKQPRVRLEFIGHDRPGIVRDIARAIALRHVNVVELQTGCFSAAMSGETMFKATAMLQLPEGANVAELHDALESVADELGLDLVLERLPEGEAV
jgi:glycine cleavage system regulatory protein